MSHRSRDPQNHRFFIFLALALALLPQAPPAQAQFASVRPTLGPVSLMHFVRAGTFEVWQDTTRLGTEFYASYLTAGRDSSVTSNSVVYELKQGKGQIHYEKNAIRINYVVGNKVKTYQVTEQIGERSRALAITTFDTTATVYHEADGQGDAQLLALPRGRVYMLDPSVYEQVETIAREFLESGFESRKVQAMLAPRDTFIELRVARGPKEKIPGPDGKKMQMQRVEIFDDLTKIEVWLDEAGNLVQLEAPAQKVRVRRLPPGEDEAHALAISAGPDPSGSSAAKR